MECSVSKQWRTWSDAAECGVWSGYALFADVPGLNRLKPSNMSQDKHYMFRAVNFMVLSTWNSKYEGCSNMNASSFITFFTYMQRQNVIPFWKELFVAFKMAPNIKKHSVYVSSYRHLYKSHSYILKSFWSKLPYTFWYMCGYSVISL